MFRGLTVGMISKEQRAMHSDYSVTREQVESVLDRIRPALRANGKDVDLCRIEENDVKVTLKGDFGSELGSMIALKLGIERSLRQSIRGIREVIAYIPETGQYPSNDQENTLL